MQGDRMVIRELNKNLGLLLVTINQYFLTLMSPSNMVIQVINPLFIHYDNISDTKKKNLTP